MRLSLLFLPAAVVAVIMMACLAMNSCDHHHKGSSEKKMMMKDAENMPHQELEGPSITDCLQAASGGDECRKAFDGQCVWCAEPIYGLCVTHSYASKLGKLPFFKCDKSDGEEEWNGEGKEDTMMELQEAREMEEDMAGPLRGSSSP